MTPARRILQPGSLLLLLVAAIVAAIPVEARSQSPAALEDSPTSVGIAARGALSLTYVRPTERTKLRNYAFDAFGPYPIANASITAGIDQYFSAPPEWGPDLAGYGKRFASDFAIAAVGTTARYGLAQAFREDTLYYRCECSGAFPRLGHAAISTLTGRRGGDGRRIFSFSALAATYAGPAAAVYGWYPNRFGSKDVFRMGNYTLLGSLGENIALEFFYSGPHSLLSRIHLNNSHGSPLQGPNR